MKTNNTHSPGKIYQLDENGTKGTYVKYYDGAFYFKLKTNRHPYEIAKGDAEINGLVGFYDCDQEYKEVIE